MSEFFVDAITGIPSTFTARSNITGGYPLNSSYAPDFLQMYWLLTQWITQEETERQNNNGKFFRKRGISMKVIPIPMRKRDRPQMLKDIEPLFEAALKYEGKGAHVHQYRNPVSNEVDLATITLDLRVMRQNSAVDLSTEEATPNGGE